MGLGWIRNFWSDRQRPSEQQRQLHDKREGHVDYWRRGAFIRAERIGRTVRSPEPARGRGHRRRRASEPAMGSAGTERESNRVSRDQCRRRGLPSGRRVQRKRKRRDLQPDALDYRASNGRGRANKHKQRIRHLRPPPSNELVDTGRHGSNVCPRSIGHHEVLLWALLHRSRPMDCGLYRNHHDLLRGFEHHLDQR